MKLSVYVPVHNEEARLAVCLHSLAFADEIIVVLDKCTDRSKEIAQAFGAVLLEGSWAFEGERRNAAMQACTGDWILDIDADENVPLVLGSEIRRVIATSPYDLHAIPFDNYIGNRLVKHGWGAYIGVGQKVALYRKGAKTYDTTDLVHPTVRINGKYGPPLEHAITHYLDKDLSDTFARFDRYTTAHAKELLAKNDVDGFARNFVRIFTRFYKCFVRRKGYKEGSLGFIIAMLAGLYPMVSYIKARYGV